MHKRKKKTTIPQFNNNKEETTLCPEHQVCKLHQAKTSLNYWDLMGYIPTICTSMAFSFLAKPMPRNKSIIKAGIITVVISSSRAYEKISKNPCLFLITCPK
jgi:hypothetical protein